MGGIEHVAHGETSVLDGCEAGVHINEYYKNHRSTIEGVAISTHDLGIQPTHAVTHGFVGDGKDDGALCAVTAGSVGTSFADGFNVFVGGYLVGVCTYTSAGCEVVNGLIHDGEVIG